MGLNRKLTPLIAGRTIRTHRYLENLLEIAFTDGSIIRIKTSAPTGLDEYYGRTLRRVRQKDTLMQLDFADDTTAEVILAEAMSSVMLRDKHGVMEYAD
jgi:hypothetical protein